MSFSIPGYWEETTPGERARLSTSAAFREALDARLREPMRPLTNPEVLGKLLPSEPSGALSSEELDATIRSGDQAMRVGP